MSSRNYSNKTQSPKQTGPKQGPKQSPKQGPKQTPWKQGKSDEDMFDTLNTVEGRKKQQTQTYYGKQGTYAKSGSYDKKNYGKQKYGEQKNKQSFNKSAKGQDKSIYPEKSSSFTVNKIISIKTGNILKNIHEKENRIPVSAEYEEIAREIYSQVSVDDRFQKTQGGNFESVELLIKTTMLCEIVNILIVFSYKNEEFDSKKYILEELSKLSSFIMDAQKWGNNDKSATGFTPLNELFWSREMGEIIKKDKKFNQKLLIEKTLVMVRALKALGVNPMQKNSKEETSLDSYTSGCAKGRTVRDPMIIRELLTGDMSTLISKIVNSGIAKTMSDMTRRKFKLACILDCELLCRTIVINILESSSQKKTGYYFWVNNMTKLIVDALKITKTEFDDEKNYEIFWLKQNYKYSEEHFKNFLSKLANIAISILNEKETMSKKPRAWDTIGALISEIAIRINDASMIRKFFDSQALIVESKTNKDTKKEDFDEAENQILTMVSHAIVYCNEKSLDATPYITQEITNKIEDMSNFFSNRVRMCLDSRIFQAFGEHPHDYNFDSDDFEGSCVLESDEEEVANDKIERIISISTNNFRLSKAGEPKRVDEMFDVDEMKSDEMKSDATKSDIEPIYEGEWFKLVGILKTVKSDKRIEIQTNTICSIVFNSALDINPKVDETSKKHQISNLAKVLTDFVDRGKITKSLESFKTDLSHMSDEDRSYLWENKESQKHFSMICEAFDVDIKI